jgi:methyl-accepting chemotaxis protein
MKNMKVSAKLITSFVLVIAFMIVVGGVGIFGMSTISDGSTKMYEEQTRPLESIGDAREYFQRLRVQLRNVIIFTGDDSELISIADDTRNREEGFARSMQTYRAGIDDSNTSVVSTYTRVMASFESYQRGMRSLERQAREGVDSEVLFAYMTANITQHAEDVVNGLSDLNDYKVKMAGETAKDNGTMFTTLLVAIIVVIALSVVIAFALAFYISGVISKPLVVITGFMKRASTTGDISVRPDERSAITTYGQNRDELGECLKATNGFIERINEQMALLEKVADGDLTVKPQSLSETDKIGKSLQRTVTGLCEIFGDINESTHQVSDGSRQVAEGAQSLAQGSTEQAASVEELSATINDIEQKTRENAGLAEKAASLANNIKGSAEKGSSQMDEMVAAVNEINQASQNISKVIKVIDDIAFQTNILALNAAVEAARAGQHGKGFAVVAEEVRNLAAKSAEAAKDTGGLIASSMEKAELGARIAKDTADSLGEIVDGIGESSQLVSEISSSSREQSEAISQITMSLDQVSNVIQQTSATAEQSAAASEEMSGQSDVLRELVARFRL